MLSFLPRLVLCCVCLWFLGAGARAQTLPGAGGFVVPSPGEGQGRESHAWAIVPDSGTPRFLVLHVPPRGSVGSGESVAPDGALTQAATIEQAPELIAAWESTLYLAFSPDLAQPGERKRRLLTVTASRGVLGGSWVFDTGAGRLSAEPSIPGTGPLLGFVGSSRGPLALLNEADWDGLTLLLLSEREWRRVPLPPEGGEGTAAGLAPPPILVATMRGPALFIRDRVRPGVWTAEFPEAVAPGVGTPGAGSEGQSTPAEEEPRAAGSSPRDLAGAHGPVWTWTPLPFGAGEAASLTGPVFEVRGRLIIADKRGAGSLTLLTPGGAGLLELARVEGLPPVFAVAPLEQSARIVVVCPERVDEPPPPAGRLRPGPESWPRYEYHVREVSALTGRTLYAGKPMGTSPVSPAQFRLLVFLLLGVMVVILLFVLRPTGPGGSLPLVLPERTAMAEPGRRLAAAVFDLAPALLLASKVTGVGLSELASLEGLLGGGGGLMVLLDGLAVAFVHTTVCEWLFRRSLGKALVGCEVVQVVMRASGQNGELLPEATRPALWRAAVRNAVKWGLAPVALLGLGSPDRRHLGDRLAGLAVVVKEAANDQ